METPITQDNTQTMPVMYVFVRTDIAYVHRAVQGGHAVAQYLIHHPRVHKGVEWNNGTMVYLAVKDESELMTWVKRLHDEERRHAVFTEPDWGDTPQFTAMATIGFKGDFPLKTVRMPVGFFPRIHSHIHKIKRSILGK